MAKHLIITVDDAGKTAVESYAKEIGSVHPPQSPNLSALEASGIRFRNFFVNPSCSPTRAMLMNGQYAFRSGIGANAKITREGPPYPSSPALPKLLAGHDSALFGKWHLATKDNGGVDSYSTFGGFDTWRAGVLANILFVDPRWHTYYYWDKITDGVTTLVGDTGNPPSETTFLDPPGNDAFNRDPRNYNTTVIVDEARAWLQRRSSDWIMSVNLSAPHAPLHKPPTAAERQAVGLPPMLSPEMEAVVEAYDSGSRPPGWEDTPSAVAAYIAMCETFDHEIGRLLAAPEIDTDVDTWVWFLSDNGQSILTLEPPFTAAKGTTYDMGTCVPLIVSGPGIAGEKGSTCDRLAHVTDVFRTICAIEGVDPAAVHPRETFDGVDLSQLFTDVTLPGPRGFVYVERFQVTGTTSNPKGGILDSRTGTTRDPDGHVVRYWERAILDEDWKLRTVHPTGPQSTVGDGTCELYRHDRMGAQKANGPHDEDFDVERAAEAAERLRKIEEQLLP